MTASQAAPANMVGKVVLGRYRVLRHLADGGMGAIYLARSEGSAGFVRPVVIKCILPDRVGDAELLSMFTREARIMSNLRHPGIVNIIDFADEGSMQLMVMEYVHGFHLGRWHKYVKQRGDRFPVEIAIYIVLHVLRALDYAHRLKGPAGAPLEIVHRDVTPSNVLISVDGHVKLADFGIARTAQEHTDASANVIKGKFPYLAPEILQGSEPTHSSDVYSAGLILHELLTGHNEFRASEPATTVANVITHIPTRVDQIREDVPKGLADVVAKSLAKLPDSRYADAGEMANALSRVRRLSEDEGARELARRADRDFNDPEMARLFQLPELNRLEESWTTPSGTDLVPDADVGVAGPGDGTDERTRQVRGPAGAPQPPGEGHATADQPTEILTPKATPAPTSAVMAAAPEPVDAAPARRSSLPLVILIGMAIVSAAAVAIVALVLSRDDDSGNAAEPVIVVSDRTRGAAADPPVADAGDPPAVPQPAGDAGAVAKPPADDPPDRKRPRSKRPRSKADELNSAFAAQKPKIARCFEKHAVEVSGTPSISLRVRVLEDGSVGSAELIPSEVGSTPLGRCVIGVARAARFAKQAKAITFRVPIKARAN